jgi:protein TonB
VEPALARNTAAWPVAGAAVVPLQAIDLDLTNLHGSPQLSHRAMQKISSTSDASGELDVTPAGPLVQARPAGQRRKWTAAIVVSCLLHATVAAAFFLIAPAKTADPKYMTQVEGSDQSGDMVVGSDDRLAAGAVAQPDVTKVTLVPMLDAKPVETVEAQPVTAQPAEDAVTATPVTETLQPVKEAAEQPEPEVSDPLPEILAVDTQQPVKDDNVVQRPAAPAPTTNPAEIASATPVKTANTTDDTPAPKPDEKQLNPDTEERPQSPRKFEKAPAKPAKQRSKAGSGGEAEVNDSRGATDGREANLATEGRGRQNSAAGKAAASNYTGDIRRKLGRESRKISTSAKAKARNIATVSFVVNANGSLDGVGIVKSSGSPELDQAALAVVSRAAPFPPIPPDTGRTSWPFKIQIGPF